MLHCFLVFLAANEMGSREPIALAAGNEVANEVAIILFFFAKTAGNEVA